MQPWVEEVAALVEEEAGALVEEVAALVEEEAGALVEEEAARSSSKKCFLHYTQNFMTPCVIMQKILVGNIQSHFQMFLKVFQVVDLNIDFLFLLIFFLFVVASFLEKSHNLILNFHSMFSSISARDRAQGRIPAAVFSLTAENSSKQLLTTETKQIDSILTKLDPSFFCSTTFKLQVRAGSGSSVLLHSGNVLPIKLARNEETGEVMNMVFVWAEEGSKLEVDVPVVFKGVDSCPGLKKECIPQKIEVDISNLDIGDRIFMKDIEVDPSLKLLSGNDTKPICKIVASEVENQFAGR
ncbi:uncharacterized protein LOC130803818 [Amaranthus tricolor]|uniref:uncharacterized protein LOC130803818 n=1 Tax=Amaranthus tricolor TaxID=29722 RepID=UPI002586923C|nr:uncharacterized protein LOC130803818 [Amaranthus tricolor]